MPENLKSLKILWKRIVAEWNDASAQASIKLSEANVRTREHVVQVITRKNNLQQDIECWELEIQRLEKEIEAAQGAKDEALIKRLQNQQTDYQDLMAIGKDSLNEVREEVESIKAKIEQELETHQRLIVARWFFPG